ncbi:MAG: N-acetyltransferase [Hyphomicrobiales bacterium]|nr:N-acetyltransferase [Hyphomicrobiales bacterium]
MVAIRPERPGEAAAREALLDLAYGPARFTKTSERLREGRLPALALVASADRRTAAGSALIGTVRLWHVSAGRARPALLLGPLAVHPDCRQRGIGAALVQDALRRAASDGHGAVLLVGNPDYYARFGFSRERTGALWLPGPYEQHRLLGHELAPGALDGVHGLIGATGAIAPPPDLAARVAGLGRNDPILAPRAA